MKLLLNNIFYSFPVQLLMLHFRKYQVLLLFWALMASTINSGFMKSYGADALFFVPEYLGEVNALSGALVGISMGIFFMSWNITTFILHTKRFKFLATASEPFLKYCINNSILPLIFLTFYLIKSIRFNINKELFSSSEEFFMVLGFIGGLALLIFISFILFFGADRGIHRILHPQIKKEVLDKADIDHPDTDGTDNFGLNIGHYFSTRFKLRKARSVKHYDQEFLDSIFKHHHFAAMISILFAFIFLIAGGFFLDVKFFQAPAAVSITIFFAIMVAVIGALTYFLQSWSMLFIIALLVLVNILYQNEIIDPRNKAYGIDYTNKSERPEYSKKGLLELCTPENVNADKANMLSILNNWKKKQQSEKPLIFFINVSGGGLRSATFTINTLQKLDSITNGRLMHQTFLISGASGGMLSATYYRDLLLLKKRNPAIQLNNPVYADNITQDLLNPVFSSLVSRDLFSPVQKFSVGPYQYVKDRGYAFEEKLSENSKGVLNKQLKDYSADEKAANIPLIIFNSTITRDGRKMMVCSQPVSFMMKPASFMADTSLSPDAVDFAAFFAKQNPHNMRLLSVMRMNATFPYVLPNVWLPSSPVIDVMDAGLRDNFGQETTLRFIDNFKDWIEENTSGVVIIQLRDRIKDNWHELKQPVSITDMLIKPATMLQNNWFKLQDYFESNEYNYLNSGFNKINRLTFMYVPEKEDQRAALNFHLTAIEKKDVIASFNSGYNQQELNKLLTLMK